MRLQVTYEMARWLQDNELNAGTEAAFEEMVVTVTEFAVGGLMAPTRLLGAQPVVQLHSPARAQTERSTSKTSKARATGDLAGK